VGAPTAWIVDIDGTLARMTGRSPFDWARVGEDEPVVAVVSAVTALARDGHRIIVMSGRDAVCRTETEQWLALHDVPYDDLHMRPEGNTEQDAVIKRRLFDEHVRHQYAIVGVLDDRDQVVALWRSLGLPCFQVAPGDF
jgi:alkanesulfonate monooxygenase SsuD/methylene tetrahydromethanopterin reductase-like flavin-dependent oxidoreductase (luciferase family)